MEDLSLHILDVVENSIAAEAKRIEISIHEDIEHNRMIIEIKDDGKGMDEAMLSKALDPFVTTRTTRKVGLGLPLFAEAARAANGRLTLQSKPGKGTIVQATFQHDHIDRKPLGDMNETMITLILGNPEIDFFYRHQKNHSEFVLDTKKIKEQLGGLPINSSEIINWIREYIREGLKEISVS